MSQALLSECALVVKYTPLSFVDMPAIVLASSLAEASRAPTIQGVARRDVSRVEADSPDWLLLLNAAPDVGHGFLLGPNCFGRFYGRSAYPGWAAVQEQFHESLRAADAVMGKRAASGVQLTYVDEYFCEGPSQAAQYFRFPSGPLGAPSPIVATSHHRFASKSMQIEVVTTLHTGYREHVDPTEHFGVALRIDTLAEVRATAAHVHPHDPSVLGALHRVSKHALWQATLPALWEAQPELFDDDERVDFGHSGPNHVGE